MKWIILLNSSNSLFFLEINRLTNIFKSIRKPFLEQTRNRVTCGRSTGKEKSVKTAMARYFRISKRIWIHAAPGYHHKLWKKPQERRYLLQQSYLVERRMSRTLERMAGIYYKKLDMRYFVDKPFSLYQSFIKKEEKKFFP
jgi:hypothetical protein